MSQDIKSLIRSINQGDAPLRRLGTITRQVEAVKQDDGTEKKIETYALSFSSEEPYERWFGMEILGHKSAEVDIDWINGGRAPLLNQHNPDQQIGVVQSAKISDGRGTAVVRFGAGALAQEIKQDVDDGIRGNVSVGYEVLDMVLVKQGSTKTNTPDEYRVTKWRPREVSIVSIPADPTVGVGRSNQQTNPPKVTIMPENTPPNDDHQKAIDGARTDAVTKERQRIEGILSIGRAHRLGDDAEKAAREGMPLEDFKELALKRLAEGHKPLAGKYDALSKNEKAQVEKYSMIKAISSQFKGGQITGFEAEMHQEAEREAREAGAMIKGVGVPYVCLHRNFLKRAAGDLTAADEGENIITEDFQAGSFIDVLRNRLVLTNLGARFMGGLSGNVIIPRKLAGVEGEWLGENDALEDEEITLGQLVMTPKRVGATIPYTKQLLLQSSIGVEQMVRDDFAGALAVQLQFGALRGTGSNDQPLGVLSLGTNASEITLGTHGKLPTLADFVELETKVNKSNIGMGRRAYLLEAELNGYSKSVPRFANASVAIQEQNQINGYPVAMTNTIPSGLTKGTSVGLTAASIFGNWEELLIGMWGGLDVVVDEYTLAKKGEVQVTQNMFADVGVRYPKAFSYWKDALTK
jgi:HK97 family phage major capsid protein